MWITILMCWLGFVALVYLFLWYDTVHYRLNLPKVYRKIIDVFTEEE